MAAIVFFGLVLQTGFIYAFSWNGAAPDLLLVTLLVLVILTGFDKIWWFILISAVGLDLFSGFSFGVVSFSFLFSVFIVGLLDQKIFSTAKAGKLISLISAGFLIYYFILFSVLFFFEIGFFLGWRDLIIKLIFDLILAFAIFYVLEKPIKKIFG